jgi:hypothetical protein
MLPSVDHEDTLMCFHIGDTPWAKCGTVLLVSFALWASISPFCYAQRGRAPRSLARASHTHVPPSLRTTPASPGKSKVVAASHPLERQPSTLSDAPQLATMSFTNGILTIEANNSDLTDILQTIATISGMTISGLNKGPRIFGVYGPANSRDVLVDLLTGSNYSFIMVGGSIDGAPRELLLTLQQNHAPAPNMQSVRSVSPTEGGESDQLDSTPDRSVPSALGPGAVSPAPSQNDLDDNSRTQRTLQRLQHMQERQTPQQ